MTTPDASSPGATRKRRLLIFGALLLIVAALFVAYDLLYGRYHETTDDAYVAADILPITSEIAGTVTAVHVDDTQQVERGQLLVELDPADAEVGMAAARAALAQTVRQVRALVAQAGSLEAQVRERVLQHQAAQADLERRLKAGDDGAVAAEDLAHARDRVAQSAAALATAREALRGLRAQVEGTTLATHPQVLAAAARVREAALTLERTRILAPATGTVARRAVQIGARIAPGTPLMFVAALSGAWVDANFKEVQLAKFRIGQPVELRADFYGDDVIYHGRVAGLGAGSGSAFALLPAQNASGNWIKIVQRVPVRIALDPGELAAHPLRVGLSMHATVDLHDTSGPLIAERVRETPQRAPMEAGSGEVEREIARIIAENSGAEGAVSGAD